MQREPQSHFDRNSPGLFRWQIEVGADAIDVNGHVNNVVYVQWMQDVAVKHSNETGGTRAMREANGLWVVRSHSVEYLRPAFAGDRIEIITWVASLRRASSLRRYQFIRIADRALLVRGQTDWVFVSAKTNRPSKIPDTVRACFSVIAD